MTKPFRVSRTVAEIFPTYRKLDCGHVQFYNGKIKYKPIGASVPCAQCGLDNLGERKQ